MTIKEAIEKAGPGGKIRRECLGTYWELSVDFAYMKYKDGSCVMFDSVYDIIATDWQVVEPEQIEVGDVVKRKDVNCLIGDNGCKITGISESRMALMAERLLCTCTFAKWQGFTLIHKGPRKHVFEHTLFNLTKDHCGDTILACHIQGGMDTRKTYRMTLEEIK